MPRLCQPYPFDMQSLIYICCLDESLKKEAQDDVADNTAREEIYVPRVGDVLVAINDNLVTHLNHSEVSRLVQRIKKYVGGPIRFHFRRHISSQEDQVIATAIDDKNDWFILHCR